MTKVLKGTPKKMHIAEGIKYDSVDNSFWFSNDLSDWMNSDKKQEKHARERQWKINKKVLKVSIL